jgi:uncharacterized RDD family membrane protein YckC/soluble cytochrome b562
MPEDLQPQLSPDAASSKSPRPTLPVPGFWPRAVALVIDVGLLTVVSYYVARYGYEALYPARMTCQVLAAMIAFAYFWVCSTSATNGQTLGKKILGLRTVSVSGKPTAPGLMAVRALAIQAIIFAYVAMPILRALRSTDLLFPLTVSWFVAVVALAHGAAAFAAADAVFCGLHPRKRSLHDLLARTAVLRAGSEEEGLAFVRDWDDACEAKLRLARWPAAAIAAVMMALLIQIVVQGLPLVREQGRALDPARQALRDVESIRLLALRGPSEEDHAKFQEEYRKFMEFVESNKEKRDQLVQAGRLQEAKRYEAPTTETLRFVYDGRKFHLVFDCAERFTSETLARDPRCEELAKRLPGLAEDLSARFFTNDKGKPAPYTGIQVEFIEILPLYLYNKPRLVWRDVLPVAARAPEGKE